MTLWSQHTCSIFVNMNIWFICYSCIILIIIIIIIIIITIIVIIIKTCLKKNKIKNTCGCCGCYCCEWNLIPLVQSCIFSVSTFILLWLYSLYLSHQVHATARSRGFISSWFQDLAGNKPLTVLVKKVSVTKWINVPIKKRKVRKPEKLWQKAACISGAKSTEKWSFLYHLFVVVVVFVCVHVFSIKMNK